MKVTATLLLAGLAGLELLSVGCSTVSSRQDASLQAASDRYARVSLSMSREELVRTLGAPQTDGAHLLVWKVQYGSDNFALLGAELDSADRVAAIARLQSRYVWPKDARPPTFEPDPAFEPGHARQLGDLVIRTGYQPVEIQKLPGFPDSFYQPAQGHLTRWHYSSN